MINIFNLFNFCKKIFFPFNNKFQIFLLFLIFFTISILDLIGLILLPIFFSSIFSYEYSGSAMPFNYFNNLQNMNFIIYFLFISLIIRIFVSIFSNYFIIRTVQNIANYLRVKIFISYFNIPLDKYSKIKISDKILNIQKYIDDYTVLLNSFLRICSDLIISSTIIIFLLIQNFNFVFLTIIFFIIFFYLYYKNFITKTLVYGKVRNFSTSNIIGISKTIFDNFKEIKSLYLSSFFTNIFKSNSNKINEIEIKSAMITTSPKYIFESFFLIALLILFIFFSILNQDIKEYSTFLISVAFAASKIIPMINQFIASLSNIFNRKNSLDLLTLDWNKNYNISKSHSKLLNNNFDKIEIKNLYYENENEKLFNNLNISFKSNSIVGIFGPSGTGKTTLVDILLGYRKPQSGELLIDNFPVGYENHNINKWSSYTSRIPLLINKSIVENISFKETLNESDLDKIINSLKSVNFYDFIQKLPHNYNYVVEENGKNFSEGQKQRLGIARALYFDKRIMIFDEATSSLDQESEREIFQQIKKNLNNKIIIIISHNMKLIDLCNEAYSIKDKKIIKVK